MHEKTITVSELTEFIGGRWEGDGSLIVQRPNEPKLAGENDIALAADHKFLSMLADSRAKVAILPEGTLWQDFGLEAAIFVKSARRTMVEMSKLLEVPWSRHWEGQRIHETAIIDVSANIADDVYVGPFTIIGPDVKIESGTIIYDHVTIAQSVQIGKGGLIYSGVRIGPNVQMGTHTIVNMNTVIGADGFSYLTPNADSIRAARNSGERSALSNLAIERINSLGSVCVGDRVEFGASCTVDRGTLANTSIGNGTKIDNLVHIAHNVTIGENCLICGQVGIAGSSKIGDRTILGGQVGVADHTTVGSEVIAAGKSAISSNVASGQTVMGNPAIKMSSNIESYKAYRRLPRLMERVKKLEKKLFR